MHSVHLLNMGNTEEWLNREKKTHSLYFKISISFLSLDSGTTPLRPLPDAGTKGLLSPSIIFLYAILTAL